MNYALSDDGVRSWCVDPMSKSQNSIRQATGKVDIHCSTITVDQNGQRGLCRSDCPVLRLANAGGVRSAHNDRLRRKASIVAIHLPWSL